MPLMHGKPCIKDQNSQEREDKNESKRKVQESHQQHQSETLTSAVNELDDGLGTERAAELLHAGREDDQVLVEVLIVLGEAQRGVVGSPERQLVAPL